MNAINQNSIGKKIQFLREKAGLSRTEFSVKSGIHYSLLWRYEKGRREPMASTLMAICKSLKVSLSAFDKCDAFNKK